MKTLFNLHESFLPQARWVMKQVNALWALTARGLGIDLARRKEPTGFRLRRATSEGYALQATLTNASWEQILELCYEGRGA